MGNVFGATISVMIDWLAGSVSATIWEWVFQPYQPGAGKAKTFLEGSLQLGALIVTVPYMVDLLTPGGIETSNSIGLVGALFFAFMYSDNLMAKLKSSQAFAKNTTLLYAGGLQKNGVVKTNRIKKKVEDEASKPLTTY